MDMVAVFLPLSFPACSAGAVLIVFGLIYERRGAAAARLTAVEAPTWVIELFVWLYILWYFISALSCFLSSHNINILDIFYYVLLLFCLGGLFETYGGGVKKNHTPYFYYSASLQTTSQFSAF